MNRLNSNNIYSYKSDVQLAQRELLNNHKSLCVWFTGLSGSGKSTIASQLEKMLYEKKIRTYHIDGDNLRTGLNSDLKFSHFDRNENIRRAGEVAKLFVDAGIVVIASFISPFKKDRDSIRNKLQDGKFIEVFVNCDLKTCEERDPKMLYKKARANEILNFTGISSPYEKPDNPELILSNGLNSNLGKNTEQIYQYVMRKII